MPGEDLGLADGIVVGDRRAYSAAAVLSVLRNEPRRPAARLDLSGRDELPGFGEGIRPLLVYDQLVARPACAQAAEGMVAS